MSLPELTRCMVCGEKHAQIIEDPRYNGLRGFCHHCGNNWPES